MSGHAVGTLTVGDVTVPAALRNVEHRIVTAGWMPDTEGLDMSIVAQPGRKARLATGRATYNGTIIWADPENCEVRIDIELAAAP